MILKMINKIVALTIIFTLVIEQSGFAQVAGPMGIPAYINGYVSPDKFRPLQLRSLTFDQIRDDFNLYLDKGDIEDIRPKEIKENSAKLSEYFQIGLRLPNSTFWVNLRPDAQDQIIDPRLENTDLGKVMLEADLQLKKDMANFTSPQTDEGKKYWDALYKKAEELFGQSEISIPTLTRPWIVPGEILIRQTRDNAYIYKATLNVMLEQDHLKNAPEYKFDDPRLKTLNQYSSELIRRDILPKLTREVNSSKKYAGLRQVYYSLVLAQWFKQSHTSNVTSHKIDSYDLNGLTSKKNWSKETYFKAYKKSFSKGEYKLQETVSRLSGTSVRQYFSGGEKLVITPAMIGVIDPVVANNVAEKAVLPDSLKAGLIEVQGGNVIDNGQQRPGKDGGEGDYQSRLSNFNVSKSENNFNRFINNIQHVFAGLFKVSRLIKFVAQAKGYNKSNLARLDSRLEDVRNMISEGRFSPGQIDRVVAGIKKAKIYEPAPRVTYLTSRDQKTGRGIVAIGLTILGIQAVVLLLSLFNRVSIEPSVFPPLAILLSIGITALVGGGVLIAFPDYVDQSRDKELLAQYERDVIGLLEEARTGSLNDGGSEQAQVNGKTVISDLRAISGAVFLGSLLVGLSAVLGAPFLGYAGLAGWIGVGTILVAGVTGLIYMFAQDRDEKAAGQSDVQSAGRDSGKPLQGQALSLETKQVILKKLINVRPSLFEKWDSETNDIMTYQRELDHFQFEAQLLFNSRAEFDEFIAWLKPGEIGLLNEIFSPASGEVYKNLRGIAGRQLVFKSLEQNIDFLLGNVDAAKPSMVYYDPADKSSVGERAKWYLIDYIDIRGKEAVIPYLKSVEASPDTSKDIKKVIEKTLSQYAWMESERGEYARDGGTTVTSGSRVNELYSAIKEIRWMTSPDRAFMERRLARVNSLIQDKKYNPAEIAKVKELFKPAAPLTERIFEGKIDAMFLLAGSALMGGITIAAAFISGINLIPMAIGIGFTVGFGLGAAYRLYKVYKHYIPLQKLNAEYDNEIEKILTANSRDGGSIVIDFEIPIRDLKELRQHKAVSPSTADKKLFEIINVINQMTLPWESKQMSDRQIVLGLNSAVRDLLREGTAQITSPEQWLELNKGDTLVLLRRTGRGLVLTDIATFIGAYRKGAEIWLSYETHNALMMGVRIDEFVGSAEDVRIIPTMQPIEIKLPVPVASDFAELTGDFSNKPILGMTDKYKDASERNTAKRDGGFTSREAENSIRRDIDESAEKIDRIIFQREGFYPEETAFMFQQMLYRHLINFGGSFVPFIRKELERIQANKGKCGRLNELMSFPLKAAIQYLEPQFVAPLLKELREAMVDRKSPASPKDIARKFREAQETRFFQLNRGYIKVKQLTLKEALAAVSTNEFQYKVLDGYSWDYKTGLMTKSKFLRIMEKVKDDLNAGKIVAILYEQKYSAWNKRLVLYETPKVLFEMAIKEPRAVIHAPSLMADGGMLLTNAKKKELINFLGKFTHNIYEADDPMRRNSWDLHKYRFEESFYEREQLEEFRRYVKNSIEWVDQVRRYAFLSAMGSVVFATTFPIVTIAASLAFMASIFWPMAREYVVSRKDLLAALDYYSGQPMTFIADARREKADEAWRTQESFSYDDIGFSQPDAVIDFVGLQVSEDWGKLWEGSFISEEESFVSKNRRFIDLLHAMREVLRGEPINNSQISLSKPFFANLKEGRNGNVVRRLWIIADNYAEFYVDPKGNIRKIKLVETNSENLTDVNTFRISIDDAGTLALQVERTYTYTDSSLISKKLTYPDFMRGPRFAGRDGGSVVDPAVVEKMVAINLAQFSEGNNGWLKNYLHMKAEPGDFIWGNCDAAGKIKMISSRPILDSFVERNGPGYYERMKFTVKGADVFLENNNRAAEIVANSDLIKKVLDGTFKALDQRYPQSPASRDGGRKTSDINKTLMADLLTILKEHKADADKEQSAAAIEREIKKTVRGAIRSKEEFLEFSNFLFWQAYTTKNISIPMLGAGLFFLMLSASGPWWISLPLWIGTVASWYLLTIKKDNAKALYAVVKDIPLYSFPNTGYHDGGSAAEKTTGLEQQVKAILQKAEERLASFQQLDTMDSVYAAAAERVYGPEIRREAVEKLVGLGVDALPILQKIGQTLVAGRQRGCVQEAIQVLLNNKDGGSNTPTLDEIKGVDHSIRTKKEADSQYNGRAAESSSKSSGEINRSDDLFDGGTEEIDAQKLINRFKALANEAEAMASLEDTLVKYWRYHPQSTMEVVKYFESLAVGYSISSSHILLTGIKAAIRANKYQEVRGLLVSLARYPQQAPAGLEPAQGEAYLAPLREARDWLDKVEGLRKALDKDAAVGKDGGAERFWQNRFAVLLQEERNRILRDPNGPYVGPFSLDRLREWDEEEAYAEAMNRLNKEKYGSGGPRYHVINGRTEEVDIARDGGDITQQKLLTKIRLAVRKNDAKALKHWYEQLIRFQQDQIMREITMTGSVLLFNNEMVSVEGIKRAKTAGLAWIFDASWNKVKIDKAIRDIESGDSVAYLYRIGNEGKPLIIVHPTTQGLISRYQKTAFKLDGGNLDSNPDPVFNLDVYDSGKSFYSMWLVRGDKRYHIVTDKDGKVFAMTSLRGDEVIRQMTQEELADFLATTKTYVQANPQKAVYDLQHTTAKPTETVESVYSKIFVSGIEKKIMEPDIEVLFLGNEAGRKFLFYYFPLDNNRFLIILENNYRQYVVKTDQAGRLSGELAGKFGRPMEKQDFAAFLKAMEEYIRNYPQKREYYQSFGPRIPVSDEPLETVKAAYEKSIQAMPAELKEQVSFYRAISEGKKDGGLGFGMVNTAEVATRSLESDLREMPNDFEKIAKELSWLRISPERLGYPVGGAEPEEIFAALALVINGPDILDLINKIKVEDMEEITHNFRLHASEGKTLGDLDFYDFVEEIPFPPKESSSPVSNGKVKKPVIWRGIGFDGEPRIFILGKEYEANSIGSFSKQDFVSLMEEIRGKSEDELIARYAERDIDSYIGKLKHSNSDDQDFAAKYLEAKARMSPVWAAKYVEALQEALNENQSPGMRKKIAEVISLIKQAADSGSRNSRDGGSADKVRALYEEQFLLPTLNKLQGYYNQDLGKIYAEYPGSKVWKNFLDKIEDLGKVKMPSNAETARHILSKIWSDTYWHSNARRIMAVREKVIETLGKLGTEGAISELMMIIFWNEYGISDDLKYLALAALAQTGNTTTLLPELEEILAVLQQDRAKWHSSFLMNAYQVERIKDHRLLKIEIETAIKLLKNPEQREKILEDRHNRVWGLYKMDGTWIKRLYEFNYEDFKEIYGTYFDSNSWRHFLDKIGDLDRVTSPEDKSEKYSALYNVWNDSYRNAETEKVTSVRVKVIETLGKLGTEEAIEKLMRIIFHEDYRISDDLRYFVLATLAGTGNTTTLLPQLEAIMATLQEAPEKWHLSHLFNDHLIRQEIKDIPRFRIEIETAIELLKNPEQKEQILKDKMEKIAGLAAKDGGSKEQIRNIHGGADNREAGLKRVDAYRGVGRGPLITGSVETRFGLIVERYSKLAEGERLELTENELRDLLWQLSEAQAETKDFDLIAGIIGRLSEPNVGILKNIVTFQALQFMNPEDLSVKFELALNSKDGGTVKPPAATGGVDFRALPSVVQPMGNPVSRINAANMISLRDLDKQWSHIQSKIYQGEMPYQEIKLYVSSCCGQKSAAKQLEKVSEGITNILKMEEDRALPTAPELKEILACLG